MKKRYRILEVRFNPMREWWSLRDHFAGQALAGFHSNPVYERVLMRDLSIMAYEQADAMLAARRRVRP